MNPWHPMTDPVDKKHIGKLLEELGECVAAASRCLIQGIDEREPETGKMNREWLEEEIADVWANLDLCVSHFHLNSPFMEARASKKFEALQKWHDMA